MKKVKENNNSKKFLIVAICLFVAFAIWTVLVGFNVFESINDSVHGFIFSWYSEMATKIFKTFTFLGSTLWIVSFLAGLVLIFTIFKKHGHSISMIVMILTALGLNNLVKIIIREPRPTYMMINEPTFAYPSGHTMCSTAVYGFLIYLISRTNIPKKYKWFYSILLTLITLGIMTSRIYLGAHYFSDIFGGVLASLATIFLGIYFDKKYNLIEKLDNLKKKAK